MTATSTSQPRGVTLRYPAVVLGIVAVAVALALAVIASYFEATIERNLGACKIEADLAYPHASIPIDQILLDKRSNHVVHCMQRRGYSYEWIRCTTDKGPPTYPGAPDVSPSCYDPDTWMGRIPIQIGRWRQRLSADLRHGAALIYSVDTCLESTGSTHQVRRAELSSNTIGVLIARAELPGALALFGYH